MAKGQRSSFVLRVSRTLIEEIEKRPLFCDMSRTEILNYALRKVIDEGLESNRNRMRSPSASPD